MIQKEKKKIKPYIIFYFCCMSLLSAFTPILHHCPDRSEKLWKATIEPSSNKTFKETHPQNILFNA
ncbi:MAG: hypothetical protein ACRCVL_08380, partial [Cetobacterium sp.]